MRECCVRGQPAFRPPRHDRHDIPHCHLNTELRSALERSALGRSVGEERPGEGRAG